MFKQNLHRNLMIKIILKISDRNLIENSSNKVLKQSFRFKNLKFKIFKKTLDASKSMRIKNLNFNKNSQQPKKNNYCLFKITRLNFSSAGKPFCSKKLVR